MEPPVQLSDLQLDVLRVVWERGQASVAEVHAALRPRRRLAPTTVATVLARLERRGLLRHHRQGRRFLYAACVAEDDLRRSMVEELAHRVFDGDLAELLRCLLDACRPAPEDRERLRRLLDPASPPRER